MMADAREAWLIRTRWLTQGPLDRAPKQLRTMASHARQSSAALVRSSGLRGMASLLKAAAFLLGRAHDYLCEYISGHNNRYWPAPQAQHRRPSVALPSHPMPSPGVTGTSAVRQVGVGAKFRALGFG